MLTINVHIDLTLRTPSLWIADYWARLDPVGTTLEKFENGFTLRRRIKCFPFSLSRRNWKTRQSAVVKP